MKHNFTPTGRSRDFFQVHRGILYVSDNVQGAGHYCKMNPDRVNCPEGVYFKTLTRSLYIITHMPRLLYCVHSNGLTQP